MNRIDEVFWRERRTRLLDEAARERWLRSILPHREPAHRRIANRLGWILIRLGERLAQDAPEGRILAGAK
jgi:hypothetical protein